MNASYVLGQVNFTTTLCASVNSNRTGEPRDILVNTDNNRTFVIDSTNSRVFVFDTSSGITNGMSASYVFEQADFVSRIANWGGTPTSDSKGGFTYGLSQKGKQSPYYVKIPTLGIFGPNTTEVTLTPSHTTTYRIASINLFGANFCEATITVLDDNGTELTSNTNNSYLTANTIKSPLGSIILDFFKRLFKLI